MLTNAHKHVRRDIVIIYGMSQTKKKSEIRIQHSPREKKVYMEKQNLGPVII